MEGDANPSAMLTRAWALGVKPALARAHGDVPAHAGFGIEELVRCLVAGILPSLDSLAMQQGVGPHDVAHFTSRAARGRLQHLLAATGHRASGAQWPLYACVYGARHAAPRVRDGLGHEKNWDRSGRLDGSLNFAESTGCGWRSQVPDSSRWHSLEWICSEASNRAILTVSCRGWVRPANAHRSERSYPSRSPPDPIAPHPRYAWARVLPIM